VLVLLSFALVLVATVLLVLGLLNEDGLMLIYISIGSSVAAAIVLMIALRRNKPRVEAKKPPEPLPVAEEAPAAPVEPTSAEATDDREWLAADWEEGDQVDFPIADYDDLTAGQILPLLPQLYADEVEVVEARERSTKSRPEILDRLAELRGDAPAAAAAAPAVAPTDASSAPPAPGAWKYADDEDDWFPIEDYESLSAAQIRPLLGELDPEELGLVRTRELGLGRRRSLLDDIDRRLGTTSDAAPAPSKARAPAKKVAPATKKPARGTRKAAAPARKAAAPARKAAAPARKAAPAKRAPAKKAAAAPTKAGPAKRAAPTKRAAPATKKAAPAARKAPAKKKASAATRKTPAKKSAPAKKATKRSR